MLSEPILSLIRDEHARQDGRLVEGVDLDAYLAKLGGEAEIVADCLADRCRGVAAFYCNDHATKQAFISLLLVHPRDRGIGIGRALVTSVLDVARRRGFTSCRLEVALDNAPAHAFYRSLGFHLVEERASTHLLEIGL